MVRRDKCLCRLQGLRTGIWNVKGIANTQENDMKVTPHVMDTCILRDSDTCSNHFLIITYISLLP